MSIASVMASSHLILWCPLLLLPSIFPRIRDLSNAVRIRWPKYWRFSFSISPSSKYLGLISLQLTSLVSLLSKGLSAPQFEGINSLVFCLLYGPALRTVCDHWEDHSLIQTFAGRVMSLLFDTLFRFVIVFLLRSNCLLISWLKLPSAVTLEPKKGKSVTTSIFYPSVCHEVMGLDAMILVF